MESHQKKHRSGIAGWQENERPRERLLANGAHVLTDAELLAILLRIGVQGKSAVELGRELLQRFGSLQAMMSTPLRVGGHQRFRSSKEGTTDCGIGIRTSCRSSYERGTYDNQKHRTGCCVLPCSITGTIRRVFPCGIFESTGKAP